VTPLLPSVTEERPRTQSERAALSDRRMTEAAIRLLVERGTAGATLKAIGEEAGYSRGLATHRFGSKAGLFRHLIKHVSNLWVEQLERGVGEKSGVEALTTAVDVHYRFLREAPEAVRAMYILWLASVDPSSRFKANVAEIHRAQRAGVEEWVRRGQSRGEVRDDLDPVRAAEQFVALIAGITFQWLVNPQMPLKAMHEALKREIRFLLAPSRSAGPDGAAEPTDTNFRTKSPG
jgi:AcrR family transcriptional regulator